MDALVQARGLTKYFKPAGVWTLTKAKVIKAVDDVSFEIEKGTTFGLVGESGCGKTTTGRLILRLIEPTAGQILFEEKDVAQFRRKELKEYRRKAQIIFQNPFASLNPRRSVYDSLKTGYDVYKLGDKKERREWLEALMERVGLDPRYLDRYPHQFSGGQRQRLVVARALTLNPSFIVADEPVSALDVSIQAQILNLLRELQGELNFTTLLISHDLRLIYHMSDAIGVMYLGRMVERSSRAKLYANPMHPYTQALIASAPSLDPNQEMSADLIEGELWDLAPPEEGCIFFHRCSMAVPECEHTHQELVDKEEGHAVACWRV
jgi:oligopeptide/dipeptide ABC transporter ATP-binding protein